MARTRKNHPFLTQRGEIWYVQTVVRVGGRRAELRQSTGTTDQRVAEEIGQKLITEARERLLYGVTQRHTFEEGAAKLLKVRGRNHKDDVYHLDMLVPYLGGVYLDELHMFHPQLERFIEDRREAGKTNNTINRSLEKVRRILNLATEWRDGDQPWLRSAPRIKLLPRHDKSHQEGSEALPYPAGQSEIAALLRELQGAPVTHDMALFALHTGAREGEITGLQWQWEREYPHLGVSAFHLPTSKNGRPRLIVLNSVAREIIQRQRGVHHEYVFTFRGHRVDKINNTAWKAARSRAGLDDARGPGRHFRVHDLRHTFGAWLREAGVSLEDRKALLGHATTDITTHYSTQEVGHLLECVEKLTEVRSRPSMYVIPGRASGEG